MSWAYAAGAVIAAAMLAGVAWLVVRGRQERISDPEEAATAAEGALANFATRGAVVGADGRGALAVGQDGRVVVVRRRGRQLAAREVPWNALRVMPGGVLIETGERRFGRIVVAGVDALDIRRLAPEGIAWRH